MAKCYMCDRETTSVEHVPPKCLFPEKKDLEVELDLRKNLITVESCDLHNLKKSKDDEYLLYCLVLSITSNNIALNQFKTKVLRAIKRNPNLMTSFLNNSERILVEDEKAKRFPSMGFNINSERLSKIFEHIGFALYKHINGINWNKDVLVHAEFLMFLMEENRIELNNMLSNFSNLLNIFFENAQFHGENPLVFKFQHIKTDEDFIIRAYFYENTKVTFFFKASPMLV